MTEPDRDDADIRAGKLSQMVASLAQEIHTVAQSQDGIWLTGDDLSEAISLLYDARGYLREKKLVA